MGGGGERLHANPFAASPLLAACASSRPRHGRDTNRLLTGQPCRPSFGWSATHSQPSGKMTVNEQEVSFPSPGSRNTPSILFCFCMRRHSFSTRFSSRSSVLSMLSTASPALIDKFLQIPVIVQSSRGVQERGTGHRGQGTGQERP